MNSVISLLISFLLLFTAINRFWIAFEIIEKSAAKHVASNRDEFLLRKCGASLAFRKNIIAVAEYWRGLHVELTDEINLATELALEQSEYVDETCQIEQFHSIHAHMQRAHGLPKIWPNWTFRFK